MELRKHQEECIENIEENFIENKRGLVKMFCGSGKSLIIYHSLLKYCKNLAVLVVPSINLITQFNNDYMLNSSINKFNKKYLNKNYKLMSICSKDELDNQTYSNIITTDKYEINKFINTNNEKILLVTYQSLPNLINIIEDNNTLIDIICFDEAHHILGDNISKLLLSSNNNFIENYVDKSLFFTATPKNTKDFKMYDNLTEITINNVDYNIIDNINEDNYNKSICGPLVYEYSHLDGVSDNILNDFNIRVELYSENTQFTIFETISRAILETGNNRVLTFHSRSTKKSDKSSDVLSFSSKENETVFIETFYKVLNNEFIELKNKYNKITFKGITAQTKIKSSILNEFDNAKDNEIYILSSCKTIGEGVDTKNANMICFIDPKQSYIEIIQNIGRICRKNKTTNKISTVLIPSYINIDNYNNCDTNEKLDSVIRSEMSSNGDFNGILSVLSALRQEDPYMFELCLKYPNTYTNNEFKRQFKRFNLVLDDIEYSIEDLFNEYNIEYNNSNSLLENFKILSENLNKNIKIYCKNIDEKNIRINNKYELDQCFVKTENETYIKVLGKKEREIKVERPNRNIKPFVHADNKIKVLWDIDKLNEIDFSKKIFGCFIKSTVVANSKEIWIEMYNNILNDSVKNMDKYSSWISRNKQYYKNNAGLFKNLDIKKLWENIKNDEEKGKKFYSKEELWFFKLEDYKKYYLTPEYNFDSENNLGFNNKYQHMLSWIERNIKNYRANKTLMLNNEVKKEWETFMYNSVYYDLFKLYIYTSQYNIDKWNKYLNLLINSDKILKSYKKTNSEMFKLLNDKSSSYIYNSDITDEERNIYWILHSKDKWINDNNTLFETKSEIMESTDVYNLWNDFLLNNKKIVIKSNNENEKKINDCETKFLNEIDNFKKKLDSLNERTITTFSLSEIKAMNCKNITVSLNEPKDTFQINNWLELILDDKYKKFALSPNDNFYFYLNYCKNIFNTYNVYTIAGSNIYNNVGEKNILIQEEIIKILRCWIDNCNRNYRKNFAEMSLENKDIRKDFRDFKLQYNL